jgi:hypothetical protein
MPQMPLANWHFTTPYPKSAPMTRAERDWWFSHVMNCAYASAAGPKAETQRVRPASLQRPPSRPAREKRR